MARPFVIGLTGSIGMGKSQTAKLFAEEGVPVHDADATVHRLYARGGAAVEKIAALFPAAIRDGAVDLAELSAVVTGNSQKIDELEKLVHPLVEADRDRFLAENESDIVVLDVPLLLETRAAGQVDCLVVVTASTDVQQERVLRRPGMTEEKFAALLARQLPDAQKRAQAHYVVRTDKGLAHAREQVKMILAEIRKKLRHA